LTGARRQRRPRPPPPAQRSPAWARAARVRKIRAPVAKTRAGPVFRAGGGRGGRPGVDGAPRGVHAGRGGHRGEEGVRWGWSPSFPSSDEVLWNWDMCYMHSLIYVGCYYCKHYCLMHLYTLHRNKTNVPNMYNFKPLFCQFGCTPLHRAASTGNGCLCLPWSRLLCLVYMMHNIAWAWSGFKIALQSMLSVSVYVFMIVILDFWTGFEFFSYKKVLILNAKSVNSRRRTGVVGVMAETAAVGRRRSARAPADRRWSDLAAKATAWSLSHTV
jgi:hypothetical protein